MLQGHLTKQQVHHTWVSVMDPKYIVLVFIIIVVIIIISKYLDHFVTFSHYKYSNLNAIYAKVIQKYYKRMKYL